MSFPDNYFTGVNDLLSKQIHLPIPTMEGWRSSICLALFFLHFVVESSFSNNVRRVTPFNTQPASALLLGTVINHNTEKQKFICIQLPSTFEAAVLELNFFPPPPSSLFSLVRGYDLRAPSYLPCFFRGNLIPLESVKAQRTFAYPYECHLQFPYSRLNVGKSTWREKTKTVLMQWHFNPAKAFRKCVVTIVIYVTISYGDYVERRRAAGAGPEDASRHQILEDKQWGMWQDVDWIPPSFTGWKGNLSCQKGHSLQHTPDCSLCIHMHTHTHSHERACSRAGPFHLTALSGREGILPVTVALCCPPGDGAQPLQPASLPRAGPHRASCAVTFMSYKQRWKAERSWNDTFHPASCQMMFPLFAGSERIRDHFVFICESNSVAV